MGQVVADWPGKEGKYFDDVVKMLRVIEGESP